LFGTQHENNLGKKEKKMNR
jgi:hypothetical protein